jgi:hypothetical protein
LLDAAIDFFDRIAALRIHAQEGHEALRVSRALRRHEVVFGFDARMFRPFRSAGTVGVGRHQVRSREDEGAAHPIGVQAPNQRCAVHRSDLPHGGAGPSMIGRQRGAGQVCVRIQVR